MRRWLRLGVPGASLAALAIAGSALADEPSAIAEALFRSGRELMAAEKYAEACPKFAESERVDPKPGTLMNLALCHEKTGKTASAWGEYLEAAETAHRAGESARERVARDRASALEPTLSHVVIDADPASATQVALDERVLGPGAFGTPIPIDPGDHVLHATTPDGKPFSLPFSVAAGQEAVRVQVPAVAPPETPQPELARAAALPPPVEPSRAHRGRAPSGRAIAGYVTGGAGLILIGVGSLFGVRAFADKHTVEDDCGSVYCTQAGLDAIESMKTAEAVSTITIAAGIAAIGGGLFLVLSSRPRATASTVRLSPDIAGRGGRLTVTW